MEPSEQPVIFAASAVVWRGDKVLLVKRGRPPGKNYWSLPGGKRDDGETLEETAIREVLEETGLSVSLLGLIGIFAIASTNVEYRISCFAAMSQDGDIMAGDDAAEAGWFGLDEVRPLKLAPNTLEAIQRSQAFIKA